MSLKFTKFKQNINHNKKKTRKYYKKTKKKVCVLYGGARRAPKPGKVKSLAAAYEQKLSNTQTNTKTPKAKTGLLNRFRMSTQTTQKEDPQQQKEKKPAHVGSKIWNTFSKSLSSFGMGTLGTRYKKYNWGVTPTKLKNSSSQVSQKNKFSSEAAIAADLEQKLKNRSTKQVKILDSQPNLTGSAQEKLSGTATVSTGPAKIEPPLAGPLKTPGPSTETASTTPKLEIMPTNTPKEPQVPKTATPEPSPVPGPKTTGLGGPTQPPVPSRRLKPVEPTAPPVPSRRLKPVEPTAPPAPPRSPRGEAAPPLAPALIEPPMPPKSDKPLTPLEIKLQNARKNLKNARKRVLKPLALPLTPATVVLKPVPPKNSTPVPTNTPNIPRTIINITPKESGITTFGNKKENSKSISFVQRAKTNINSGTFTKRSKNTGNVLSQDKKQVEVGELPKTSIFGNRVKKNTNNTKK